MDSFQIQLATPDHAEEIAAVLHAAFVEFKPQYTPGGFALTVLSIENLVKRWPEGPVWVATMRNAIAGTVAAVPKGELLHIRSMAVRPEARGLGIGFRLLEEITIYAKTQGHSTLDLCTTPFLHSAIRLYERFGFTRIDDGAHDLAGTPLFSMQKNLHF